MSYGADYTDLYRRAAVYVDKILKGAKPADLPVQQATKFEFVINLKAAKQIGLTIPPEFLSRANQGDQMTTVSSQRLAVTSKTGANPMFRSIVICLLLTVLLFTISPADAQQPAKIPRIGFLSGQSLSTISARIEAFRQGLRELGYVEGKNIVIEWRFAEGKLDRLPTLAAELVRLKVDVIVTSGFGINPSRQGSDKYDSYRNDAGSRSCWQRVRRQPGASWQKHHWIVNSFPGAKRQTIGASEGDNS